MPGESATGRGRVASHGFPRGVPRARGGGVSRLSRDTYGGRSSSWYHTGKTGRDNTRAWLEARNVRRGATEIRKGCCFLSLRGPSSSPRRRTPLNGAEGVERRRLSSSRCAASLRAPEAARRGRSEVVPYPLPPKAPDRTPPTSSFRGPFWATPLFGYNSLPPSSTPRRIFRAADAAPGLRQRIRASSPRKEAGPRRAGPPRC